MSFKTILTIGLLLVCNFTTFAQKKTVSVLSSGDIFKFSVESTGIYKLDYAALSSIEQLDVNNIDPRNIHIYTNNGGKIPQSLNEGRIDDLMETACIIQGEEDGSFDSGDYILLYMEGGDKYEFDNNELVFNKNPYETKNYFYLKIESTSGIRVSNKSSISNPDFVSLSTETVKRHEIDRLNLLGNFGGTQGTGKQWFGESFGNEPEQDFSSFFNFDNLIPGEADLEVLFVGRSESTTRYSINVDGQMFERTVSRTEPGDIEAIYALPGRINEKIELNNNNPSINIRYNKSSSSDEGWLDFIQIIANKSITYSGRPEFIFDRSSAEFSTFGYNINIPGISLWDVTGIDNISNLEGQNGIFGFETENKVRSFVLFRPEDISASPSFVEKVENQNLHSIQEADFVIVYYKDFKDAADKLAQHRIQQDNMTVVTADVEDIYNEFGGHNDPSSIRDFAKMIYDRDPNFRYLCLMGDGTYDYRGIVPDLQYQNFVPTYQTDESLHPVEGFPSDDFFALLSDDEGDDSLDGDLDIGVGRIPAKTLDEALNVVNKIIHYDTNSETFGDWRMKIGFTADDEDTNAHIRQADNIAELTLENHPELNQQKVYFDAFNQQATPGGARYPDANQSLISNLNNGQLILNYLGHGGPKGWAQERVFQINDIVNLKNFDRLPVLITATCSFTGFDEPSFVSAGELSLLNPSGGAIALFSTVRAVYSSQNERLTREIFKKIFTRENGEALRLGDIIRESQNSNSVDQRSSNTRKFLLFGDPSQKLALPRHNITVDEINGAVIEENQVDTIGALGKMKIKGSIKDFEENLISGFNGTLFLTVYDKANDLQTLNNDDNSSPYEFQLRKNILYKGSASVTNGVYEIEFVVPKDINFDFGPGHLSLYATNNIDTDAGGHYEDIIIGGTSSNGISDNEGPEIEIFLNDRSFQFGGQTNAEPLMIVDLSDENGINLSSTSIGHDITAVLDGDTNNALVLNEFYQPTIDQTGTGVVEFRLDQLETGLHTLTLKAWDILNNSSEKMTEFMVVENEEGFIRNVYNYPNPFTTNTQFTFEHDLTSANINIIIDVYTVSGKLVKTIQDQRFSSGQRVNNIPWNGRDDFSGKLAKGIYFYKIKLSAPELSLERESDFQKLVILK